MAALPAKQSNMADEPAEVRGRHDGDRPGRKGDVDTNALPTRGVGWEERTGYRSQ